MAFTVATAQNEITPTMATNPYLAGFGSADGGRTVSTDTPFEPLWCKAVVIRENGNPHLIMSADILALPRAMHQRIRERILGLASWDTSDILLQSTHTHNGPVLIDSLHPFMAYGLAEMDEVRDYSSWLEDTMVGTAQDALDAAETSVTLDYQVATQTFAVNRAGLPYVERDVPVLVARQPNGTPEAVVFGYGCHPVAAGDQDQYDGDFPAGACNYIENNLGAFALFLQGPAGDQNPADAPSWALRDQDGDALGATVVAAARNAGRALTGPILTQYQEVDLPFDIDTSAGNLAALRDCYASRLPNPNGQPAWYARHAQVMMARIDNDDVATSMPSPFQVWSIGSSTPLKMAFVGGELVSGYAAYFRSRYGGSNALWIGGYANESCAYLPTDEFLPPYMPAGSYEGGWEPDFPGIAGGNMTVYGHIAHFKAGSGGIQDTLINALTSMLG
ncbi:hypothetical protein SCMU_02750 [Sinomonas cyclohexanicum]|uniref:Neutral/alkaline non-lysosomal ceramidase N-terminal domain-containing protein n=1 Tax=Sinomonas cyclohexanicum TaxID=322009 RepID=A0ABN6FCI7_SINCY|nr:hypothetical protein [Corynebacterium cyclohexanicum]BCT74433.1 hypothetical protein SCMU_02750 [Corynebacterium cyclohexanicum]